MRVLTRQTQAMLLILCACIGTGQPATAEEPGLPEQIGTKFVRGVANLATGWVEIPKQVYVVGSNEGWVAGALRGPFDGLGMFVARTVAGAYEILTFPIPVPPQYQPLVQPAFVWEAELSPGSPGPSKPDSSPP